MTTAQENVLWQLKQAYQCIILFHVYLGLLFVFNLNDNKEMDFLCVYSLSGKLLLQNP